MAGRCANLALLMDVHCGTRMHALHVARLPGWSAPASLIVTRIGGTRGCAARQRRGVELRPKAGPACVSIVPTAHPSGMVAVRPQAAASPRHQHPSRHAGLRLVSSGRYRPCRKTSGSPPPMIVAIRSASRERQKHVMAATDPSDRREPRFPHRMRCIRTGNRRAGEHAPRGRVRAVFQVADIEGAARNRGERIAREVQSLDFPTLAYRPNPSRLTDVTPVACRDTVCRAHRPGGSSR
jgi:hypothetical protein